MNGKVFLGGTCNGSRWRDEFVKFLKVGWFNPVVDQWTEADYLRELEERKNCSVCLYALTPKMKGVYSVAELVDDSNKKPDKTVFLIIEKDNGKNFDDIMKKSLNALCKMVKANGVMVFSDMKECAEFINKVITSKSSKP
ncbi:nucleoside 2-deoxyribosyltransferase domain-containing protein [Desulfococcaceae bacterium HSG7]|nr:nucleoside 2-deoxyribosyltransferase domain-containing protein [Desulfococcaceae bacterium HSG9]MDM8554831.1 nucleoside 2-deoxyribosyltransferase domain-containing protein [Desulfococcaceae bacterium HSG7]